MYDEGVVGVKASFITAAVFSRHFIRVRRIVLRLMARLEAVSALMLFLDSIRSSAAASVGVMTFSHAIAFLSNGINSDENYAWYLDCKHSALSEINTTRIWACPIESY